MSLSTPRARTRTIGTVLAVIAAVLAPLSITSPSTAAEPAYIVFSSDRNEDRYNLYRMNLDGSGVTQLTSGGNNATDPAISPDGTKIAYASAYSVWVMNSDGSEPQKLVTSFNSISSLDWSPDGSKIAYSDSGGGMDNRSELHVMNADGTNDQTLKRSSVIRNVAFAPDGNIVYGDSTNAGIISRKRIWITTPDGAVHRLLREGGFDDFALPPNGRGIVLSQNAWTGMGTIGGLFYWDDIENISIVNYPPTTNLWSGDGRVGSPSVGADGRVLFHHDPEFWLLETTDNDITVVNADGTGRRKLTTGGTNDVYPDWHTGTPPPAGVAPTVTITDAPSGTITQTRPTFSFSSNQAGTFECRLYDRSISTVPSYERCSDPWVSEGTFRPETALTHGAWTFSVRAVNPSGQTSQVQTRNFNVDTGDGADLSMPVALDFGDVSYLTEETQYLQLYNRGAQTYEGFLELEGPARGDFRIVTSGCGGLARITLPGSGSCTIGIAFKPRYVNQRSATLTFEPNLPGLSYYQVDLTGTGTSEAPDAPNIVDAPEYTSDTTPTFEYEAMDTRGDQFECRIYPVGETPPTFSWCSVPQGPFHTSPVELTDGEYTFEVRSIEQGSPTPDSDVAAVDFTVDTVPPTVTIDGAPTVMAEARPAFTFSSDEPGNFFCRFDPDEGNTFMPCSGPGAMHRPADGLSNGEHVFEVRATDRAGNQGLATTSFTINAAVPLPPTDLVGTPVTATTAQVTFTEPSDTAGAMSYEVTCESSDGGTTASVTTASSPVTLEGLTNGALYTCVATSTNAAGTSVPSDPSPEFLQAVAPTAPSGVSAALSGPGEALVSFVPGDDGGAPVDVFDVQCVAEDGRATRSAQGTGSPITVTGLDAGASYACIVRATNSVGESQWSEPSALLMVPGDPDPVASITGPTTVDEGDTITVSAASSTGVGPLTFAWDTDGDGSYDDGTGPGVTLTPATHGTITIGLRVTDANDESVTTSHTVTVANVAPQVAPIADQEVTAGDALSVAGSFSDPGDNTWTATVDFGSGPESLALTGPTFTVSHASPVDGTVTVRVCDDAGACDEQTFAVEITAAPPALQAAIDGPATVNEGSVAAFSAAESTGVGPLTFAWDTDGDGSYDDGTGPGVTVTPATHGTITIGLRVTDANDETTTATHNLTVANVAPQIAPIPDQLLAHDGGLAVAGSFDDPGANTWTATIDDGSGPRALVLTGQTFSITDSAPSSGTVTVRVCDDADACDEVSFDVEVMAPPAPVALISGPSTVLEGSSADFSGRDSSGLGTLIFAWDLDGDGAYDDATDEEVTVEFPSAGTRTLGLQVTDSVGGTTVLRTITVTAVSPTVADIDDMTVDLGEEFTITGSFTDPGDNAWSATADFGDGAQPLPVNGQEFTLTHAFDESGSYDVRVQVCDDHQACGAGMFTVTVNDVVSDGGGAKLPIVGGILPKTGATVGLGGLVLAFGLLLSGWLLIRRRPN